MTPDPEKRAAKADRAEQIEVAAIERLVERLSRRFPDLARAEIERVVRVKYAQFAGSRIRTFVPTLVERSVRADLAAPERGTSE